MTSGSDQRKPFLFVAPALPDRKGLDRGFLFAQSERTIYIQELVSQPAPGIWVVSPVIQCFKIPLDPLYKGVGRTGPELVEVSIEYKG